MTTRDAGKALCLATAISCVLLHAATFLTVVPGLLILVPFFLLMGAALCTRVTQGWFPSYRRVRTSAPRGKNCHSWFVLAGLCDSPVFALLQEFGRSIERGNRCRSLRLHVQGNSDPADIGRGIQDVSRAGNENDECVAGDDSNVLPVITYRQPERRNFRITGNKEHSSPAFPLDDKADKLPYCRQTAQNL